MSMTNDKVVREDNMSPMCAVMRNGKYIRLIGLDLVDDVDSRV